MSNAAVIYADPSNPDEHARECPCPRCVDHRASIDAYQRMLDAVNRPILVRAEAKMRIDSPEKWNGIAPSPGVVSEMQRLLAEGYGER